MYLPIAVSSTKLSLLGMLYFVRVIFETSKRRCTVDYKNIAT
jgi:hypothetical protein